MRARIRTLERTLGAQISTFFVGTWSARGAVFEVVPRDMHTADPTRADEMLDGYFALAGQLMELDSRGPFAIKPPSDAFADALHSFEWLRHMRPHGGRGKEVDRAAALARSHVLNWIETRPTHPAHMRTPQLAARRALSLTNHAAFLLDSADPPAYQAIMAAIMSDVRFAFTHRALADDPTEHCRIVLACMSIGHALVEHLGVKAMTSDALPDALAAAINMDGGPVSRRPGDLPDLLADMLSLRALLETRGFAVPKRLSQTIEASMRMLRMLRHRDGAIARFHGTRSLTRVENDLIASILIYDTERGHLPVLARNTGYARLEAPGSVVLVDCAGPPPRPASREAHASALAFEWSHETQRIVSNAVELGQPVGVDTFEQRQTARQSTLCVQGRSSGTFRGTHADAELVADGLEVILTKSETAPDRTLLGRHTGYRSLFGVDHERMIALSEDGRTLQGRDRLLLPSGEAATGGRNAFALHFHLQPGLRAKQQSPNRIQIASHRTMILFETNAGMARLVDLASRPGYRGPSHVYQIVVTSEATVPADIAWRFVIQRTQAAAGEVSVA